MARNNSKPKDSEGVYVQVRGPKEGPIKMLFFERVGHKLMLTDFGCEYITKMVAFGCTIDDIASELGVSKPTLYTAHNKDKLNEAVKIGQGRLKNNLRMAQVKTAVKGNSAMLIFLGKNYLGQSDAPPQVRDEVPPMESFAKAFTEQERRLESGSHGNTSAEND